MRRTRRPVVAILAALTVVAGSVVAASARGGGPAGQLNVGLVAPLSGPSGASGQAILRGMLIAADEVNRAGGVLGRRLSVVVADVQNDRPAGVAALERLAADDGIVAVFGGIFSPVMLAQLDTLHRLRIPLIDAWGSVTAITHNGFDPNYAFRVSVSDDQADEFLARYAVTTVGAGRPGIIADTTAWGDSNVAGLTEWLPRLGVVAAGVERFDQGDTDMAGQLARLRAAGTDTLLMIANAPEGAAIVRGLAAAGWDVPVVSHWGVSGGQFVERAGTALAEGVRTLQTISFHRPRTAAAERLLAEYHRRFGTTRADDVAAPVGVAHGFDGLHLLARALDRAGRADGPAVRAALEQLGPYEGAVKRYTVPFSPDRHDALLAGDYLMAEWHDGRLVPASGAG